MDDEKEILCIALGIMIDSYATLIHEVKLDEENLELAKYLLDRASQILDKLYEDIENKPINRPTW